MRTFLVTTLLAALGLLLQTTFVPSLRFGTAMPDLLVVLCVHLALHRQTVGGAVGAFVLGYLEDSVSGGATGLNALGMCLVFSLVYLTSRHLWVNNIFSRVVVVFLASVVKTGGVLIVATLFDSLEGAWSALFRAIFFQAAFTAAVAPPILATLHWVQRGQEAEEA
jgi:rod shape-determining protein MreD